MASAGKVFGGLAGLGVGLAISPALAPLFVVVGLGLGHWFDATHDPEAFEPTLHGPTRAEIDREARERFALCVAALFLKVARADGALSDEEMAAVDRYFVERLGYDDTDAPALDRALAAAGKDSGSLLEACERCRAALSEAERLLLFNALYDLASVDGALTRSESAVLDEIGRLLGLAESDRAGVRAMHVESAGEEPFVVLGISTDASDADVKRAFRRLAARHHPDKVAHLGEMAMQMAAKRFNEVREAYERIRAARGL